jgi:uncharacterized protein (TIGR00725 family)
MANKTIAIFGNSSAKAGVEIFKIAFETGRLLALAGFDIANGGYGGTMLAAAQGAFEAGGHTIGVTCRAFKRGRANQFIKQEIATASLDERLKKLIELGQGYLVLPGSTGTLLEFATVWELRNKGFLPEDKPVILIGRFWQPLIDLIATQDPQSIGHIKIAAGPKEAVDLLLDIFQEQNLNNA